MIRHLPIFTAAFTVLTIAIFFAANMAESAWTEHNAQRLEQEQ